MTRRAAMLALLALPLGYYRAFGQSRMLMAVVPATLIIDLGQWAGIRVQHGTTEVFITSAEIYAAVEGK